MGVAVYGGDNACITGSISLNANKGFDCRLRYDFVVVLANPGFFARDVWTLKHPLEEFRMVCLKGRDKGWQFRRAPLGFQLQLRDAFVKELDGEIRHGGISIANMEHAG